MEPEQTENFDFKRDWQKANSLLQTEDYTAIVKKCGRIFEQGLKHLMFEQLIYFKRNEHDQKINGSYDKFKSIYLGTDFNGKPIERLTLGTLYRLFDATKLFGCIEFRLNSRLTNTKRMQWRDLIKNRNQVTHTRVEASREMALDFLQYSKVFLIETQLAPEIMTSTGEIKCYSCNHNVDANWHYCSHCGLNLQHKCISCGENLKPEWIVCPSCNTKRKDNSEGEVLRIYDHYCKAIWADGILNSFERVFLENKRLELSIPKIKALEIETKSAPLHAVRFKEMVEATLLDKSIDEREKEFLRNRARGMDLPIELANAIYNACMMECSDAKLFDEDVNLAMAG